MQSIVEKIEELVSSLAKKDKKIESQKQLMKNEVVFSQTLREELVSKQDYIDFLEEKIKNLETDSKKAEERLKEAEKKEKQYKDTNEVFSTLIELCSKLEEHIREGEQVREITISPKFYEAWQNSWVSFGDKLEDYSIQIDYSQDVNAKIVLKSAPKGALILTEEVHPDMDIECDEEKKNSLIQYSTNKTITVTSMKPIYAVGFILFSIVLSFGIKYYMTGSF